MKRWFKDVAHAFIVRVDWFAVIYVGGAVGITIIGDHSNDGMMTLVAAAAWIIGVPIGYAACALQESKRKETDKEMS